MAYILALDQGTTSSRAILFDESGSIVAVAQHEFEQFYPQPGWVEHDPMEILTSQLSCAVEVLGKAGARPRDVAAIGITNQRETVVVWERESGKPIHPAIVWQDRRTAQMCAALEESGLGEEVSAKTGLVLDPYFSATKVRWILDNVAGAREKADRGELAFGTVDSWLIWHLTSGMRHVTDVTNASRTLLYNIVKGEWDEELLRIFDVPASMLPKVVWSSERIGEVTTSLGLGGVEIAGIAGDQQAALFGQLCWNAGEAKNTYGTGCFLLQNVGTEFVRSKHRLITTLAASAQKRRRIRAGRQHFYRRSCGAVAARQSAPDWIIGRCGGAGSKRAGYRRRGVCPGICGTGSTPLGSACGWAVDRAAARYQAGTYCARCIGEHRVSGCGCTGSGTRRDRNSSGCAARGWRRGCK